MIKTILDIIYPITCPICEEILVVKDKRICPPCHEKLQYIKEPRCKKCSKPIEYEENEYCSDCIKKEFSYTHGYCVWVYDEYLKKSITGFKYHNKKEYSKFYIEEMLKIYGDKIINLDIDGIIPVPVHRSTYLQRGYNQAEILAKGIGRSLNIPIFTQILLRDKKTLPQKQLSDKDRLMNLQKAFTIQKKRLDINRHKLHKILLVDDIYTTGSTIEACAKVLKSIGVNEVYFINVAIGKGF